MAPLMAMRTPSMKFMYKGAPMLRGAPGKWAAIIVCVTLLRRLLLRALNNWRGQSALSVSAATPMAHDP